MSTVVWRLEASRPLGARDRSLRELVFTEAIWARQVDAYGEAKVRAFMTERTAAFQAWERA